MLLRLKAIMYGPVNLPANTPVPGQFDGEGSVCSYYVDAPFDCYCYEATVSAGGDVVLHVAFDNEPATFY